MVTRRRVIQSAAATVVLHSIALPVAARDLIREIYGATSIVQSNVSIHVPSLVENGNSVALEVAFSDVGSGNAHSTEGVSEDSSEDSSEDRVEEIKIIAPKNPEPLLATFSFGDAAGIIKVRTRIRLADSQAVTAVARTRSGKLFSASKKTVITLAACVEPLL